MQMAATELVEALERARVSSTPRSVQREYQNDLFAIAEFLSELPTFFPQLRKSAPTISPRPSVLTAACSELPIHITPLYFLTLLDHLQPIQVVEYCFILDIDVDLLPLRCIGLFEQISI